MSGNPLAVAGGLAMLRTLESTNAWKILEDAGAYLQGGLEHPSIRSGSGPSASAGVDALLYFSEKPCTTLDEVLATDRARFVSFFHGMLKRGVFLPPSPFECWFLSTAHDDAALDHVLDAARCALRDTLSSEVVDRKRRRDVAATAVGAAPAVIRRARVAVPKLARDLDVLAVERFAVVRVDATANIGTAPRKHLRPPVGVGERLPCRRDEIREPCASARSASTNVPMAPACHHRGFDLRHEAPHGSSRRAGRGATTGATSPNTVGMQASPDGPV
jgi:hypothetical protein